jgi:hypothetical protein
MVKYSCEKCGKEFTQKGHYTKHATKKNPCVFESKIKEMIEKAVAKKIDDITYNASTIISSTNIINQQSSSIVDSIITHKEIKYIDLFCGLGAFHYAFNSLQTEDTKYKCVFACDIDDNVRKIYKENYGITPEGDINNINIENIPDFDILCGGFPCQPFSIAGKKEGFEDKIKGNLFYAILKIIDIKTPNTIVLENVKNLLTIDQGETFRTIKTELENEIVARYYYQKGKLEHSLSLDLEVKKASEILKDDKLYGEILAGKYVDPEIK